MKSTKVRVPPYELGFQKATGDCIAVQDADLEYDPHDLRKLYPVASR